MPQSLTVHIHRDLRAPASARRAVEALSGRVTDDLLADVRLLVSELITNSVKYGGRETVTLKVDVESERKLRVEVIDDGSGFVPVARSRPVTQAGGWGLHLVQTLSSRWGVREGLTHVWFEIDREEQAAA
jgi:anti-sigma regulatory factor (Ser/Thr protein kinase)